MRWWRSGRQHFEATRPIEAKDYLGGGELATDLFAAHATEVVYHLLADVKKAGCQVDPRTLRVVVEEDYSDLTIVATAIGLKGRGL
jgi:hypothetical protein